MLLLLNNTEQLPQKIRNKTWVIGTIQKQAPTGRQSYAWWLNFFQTVVRDNWDNA